MCASVSSPKLDHNSVSETVKMKSRLTPLLMTRQSFCAESDGLCLQSRVRVSLVLSLSHREEAWVGLSVPSLICQISFEPCLHGTE